ncbi:anti-sigma factor antagonist, partial [Streptomyces tendae]
MRQESASPTRHLRVRRHRGHTVLEFRGEIDIASAAEIAPHLDRETVRPGARVVLDLGGIEFFDCSGLRLLYRARSQPSCVAASVPGGHDYVGLRATGSPR